MEKERKPKFVLALALIQDDKIFDYILHSYLINTSIIKKILHLQEYSKKYKRINPTMITKNYSEPSSRYLTNTEIEFIGYEKYFQYFSACVFKQS